MFPAVVYIRVLSEDFERGERKSIESSGSGAVITEDGEVLTNWHVVEKALEVRCLLSDGRHYDAEILGTDETTDLAILRLKRPEGDAPLPVARIDDSGGVEEGDFVMAMGAPWGLNRSVSIGIVSCVSRFLDDISEYSLWIQTDAAINPGNSGGPLVDTKGDIVGVNTRGMSGMADNVGFAIPAPTVRVVIDRIRQYGEADWSWTGLKLQAIRDFNKNIYFEGERGVIVADTDPDSPARAAGILARDRILSIAGQPVAGLTDEDLPAIRMILGVLPKDTPVVVEVLREGEVVALGLTPVRKGAVQGKDLALTRWDMTIKEINQFNTPDLHFHRKQGVFVNGTKYPGNALASGVRERDIIVSIGEREIASLDEAKSAYDEIIANQTGRKKVVLTVLRGGLRRQVVLDYERDYSRQ